MLGPQFGVGLCPACQATPADGIEARFAAIKALGANVTEIDLWVAPSSNLNTTWWALTGAFLAEG